MSKRRQRQQKPDFPMARTWESLFELDSVPLEETYMMGIVELATAQVHDEINKAEADGTEPPTSPDWEDHEETFNNVLAGRAPNWWPKHLERYDMKVRITPEGENPDTIGPHRRDPNNSGLGLGQFTATIKNMCGGLGEFVGTIEISMSRRDRVTVAQWRSYIVVGEKNGPRAGGSGSYEDEWDPITRHALKRADQKDELMMKMFAQSSNVIHASAAVVNASRGVNVPPPWMRGEEEEDQPFWMAMAQQAVAIAMGAATGQDPSKDAANMAGKFLNHRVQPRGLQQDNDGYQQRQLQDRSQNQNQDELGYNQYMEQEGDNDGYPVNEGDLLDDEFEDDEDYDYDDDEFDDDDYDDDDDDDDEPYYEDEDDDDENPLEGKSVEEVAEMMEGYIKDHPEKAKIRNMGIKLAGKFMGS